MDKKKFAKCILLTESTNDNEALLALRAAQSLCIKNNIIFSEHLLENNSNKTNQTKEFINLKSQLDTLTEKYNILENKFNYIYNENITMKEIIENRIISKTMHKKLNQLKHKVNKSEFISKEYTEEVNTISEKEKFITELIYAFAQKNKLQNNEEKDISEAYKNFIYENNNTYILSKKKFTEIYTKFLCNLD